jgi:hypothetical protein
MAVTCATHASMPARALAQSVSGSLTVAATILPPIRTQTVEPLSLRVEENGMARLETTAPFAGAVSAIVMSTVSSSANGFTPIPQRPTLVGAAAAGELLGAAESRREPSRLRFDIPLDAPADRPEPHDVTVHITYLIVPGT